MNVKEFIQLDLRYRYDCLMSAGKRLAAIHEPSMVIHLYSLGDFYVELRLDPVRYSILSAEPFGEDHPRYDRYMQQIDPAISA